ncbi:MAG: hypothetical protein ACD_67C00023G0003 [uncultured bacterium]|nr:MAG: hypothetical protein ACD_67C00023G0003 [uncultured bacterium]
MKQLSSPLVIDGDTVKKRLFDVAVLYCTPSSVYKKLASDCYDEYRDARMYRGYLPVVAHPPCRSWARLRHLAKPLPWERELALHAVSQVRRCGGVLEHPASSLLWDNIPEFGSYQLPPVGASADEFGGVTLSVYQSDFGHPAPKHTWLYVVGVRPGELCKVRRPGELCKVRRAGELCKVSNQPSARRMDTPEPFAKLLLSLAESVVSNG